MLDTLFVSHAPALPTAEWLKGSSISSVDFRRHVDHKRVPTGLWQKTVECNRESPLKQSDDTSVFGGVSSWLPFVGGIGL